MKIVTVAISIHLQYAYCTSVNRARYCIIIFIMIIRFILADILFSTVFDARILSLPSLLETISLGNWETLHCTCNGIAKCMPGNRPIIIVREFANFHEES